MRALKVSLVVFLLTVATAILCQPASATVCTAGSCSCADLCYQEKVNCIASANGNAEPIALCEQNYEPCLSDCPVCGDGTVQAGEDCDPGADVEGDCCDAQCHFDAPGSNCFANQTYCIIGSCYQGYCGSGNSEIFGPAPANCDDGNACTADSCTLASGCVHDPIPGCTICGDGMVGGTEQCDPGETPDPCCVACQFTTASCDDSNACTTSDTCSNGTCAGTGITCTAADQCHDVGTCNPADGMCSNPAKGNGATCTDGDICTTGDSCQDGICMSGVSVVCTASDQCHDAGVCNSETGGCSNPAKPDTSPCNDGNACTNPDQCIAGVCTAQGFATPGTACDDHLACTLTDACIAGGVCSGTGDPCAGGAECNNICSETNPGYSCINPSTAPCTDDGKVCTDDLCDGAGTCGHPPVPVQQCPRGYAILGWPPAANVDAHFGRVGHSSGRVCTDFIRLGRDGTIDGDAVASDISGIAISLGDRTNINEDAVTGGGTLSFPMGPMTHVTITGVQDTSGTRAELTDCSLASSRASTRRSGIAGLTATTTMGAVTVPVNGAQTINLTTGQNVLDVNGNVLVRAHSKLTLAGVAGTTDVIIRVTGTLTVRRDGDVELSGGLTPEQIIWVVNGKVFVRKHAYLRGTAFSNNSVFLGWDSKLDGQALGSNSIQVRSEADVNLHPWQGW